jgi:drug/metabolite transporter (DMT)-like permease
MRPKSLVHLVLLACIWGSSYLLIKVGLQGMTPIQIVLGRLSGGALVLLVLARIQGSKLPRDPRVWGHFVVLGIIGNILPYFLFGFGETHIPSSLAGVFNATTPLWTTAVAMLALPEERPSVRRIAGLLVGFGGVFVIVAPWRAGLGTASLIGELACLGAAMTYGVSFVWMRRFLAGRGLTSTTLAAGQITVAAAMLWIAAPVVAATPMHLTGAVIAAVGALGVANTGVAYILNYKLVQEAGATRASLVTYLIPVVAVFLGVYFLAEPLTWNLFAGAAFVFLAVSLMEGRIRTVLAALRSRLAGQRS